MEILLIVYKSISISLNGSLWRFSNIYGAIYSCVYEFCNRKLYRETRNENFIIGENNDF